MTYDIDSDPAGSKLYLEVQFNTDACRDGEKMEANFRKYKWCKKNFMNVIDQCKSALRLCSSWMADNGVGEVGDGELERGGAMLASCVQWTIRAAA